MNSFQTGGFRDTAWSNLVIICCPKLARHLFSFPLIETNERRHIDHSWTVNLTGRNWMMDFSSISVLWLQFPLVRKCPITTRGLRKNSPLLPPSPTRIAGHSLRGDVSFISSKYMGSSPPCGSLSWTISTGFAVFFGDANSCLGCLLMPESAKAVSNSKKFSKIAQN